jgi:hypothetical protein
VFCLLRATNAYGNPGAEVAHSTPGDWHAMPTLSQSIILFLDVEKYPPSLQYLLMTLGVILILLAVGGANFWGWFGRILVTYGRVPLFFYILHLFVIHLAAGLLGFLSHQPVSWLFHGGFFLNYPADGEPYGQGLGVVCAMWAAVVALLYWPCAWFARVKLRHPDSLLRFLQSAGAKYMTPLALLELFSNTCSVAKSLLGGFFLGKSHVAVTYPSAPTGEQL